MRLNARSVAATLAAVLITIAVGRAQAQSDATSQDASSLTEAKDLFRKGVALFNAGDPERALDYFRRSRALVASKQNTINVAICLDRLGRYDEALDLYEEVIATYGKDLTPEERASLPTVMTTLRSKLGYVDITSNVTGSVIVDGRERGKLPLGAAIRVLPGSHLLRVLKDGYKSFEARIDVALGATRTIDARLEPLSAAGGLRVEDPSLAGGDIFVDGVRVGLVPWEGTLAPGPHVVQSRKDLVGSAPTLAIVLQGQTTLLRLRSAALGAVVRIAVKPATADLRLDGVPLGHGAWEGPLPPGTYRVEAAEEGYFTKQASVVAPTSGDAPPLTALALEVDRAHPRWPKPPAGQFWFGAFAGAGLSPSLHSGAEQRCIADCERSPPAAFLVAIRAGYEFPNRLSIELTGGYLAAHASLTRVLSDRFPTSTRAYQVDYTLYDDVTLRGAFVGPGIGYRTPMGRAWSLQTRIAGGALFATSSDALSASASTGAERVPEHIENARKSVTSSAFFTSVQLGVERTVGAWTLGAGLGMFAVPFSAGPKLDRGPLVTTGDGCTDATPSAVTCAPASSVAQGERAYGPFLIVMPQVTATWRP